MKITLKNLYKGWSKETALKDLMNNSIDFNKLNIFPNWFKRQFRFINSKQGEDK